ncbi:glycoside hydrolase family 32 protein, partial [Proteiniclasticum ruminis]|uniref:glycoside hydrolase family 32 protein n=1 Tax=Proteiniclasticum ruminis TaxID=398199 RepID=UPI0028ACF095
CAAVSEDGFTFKKLGPVIGEVPGYTAHVRDPKVFRGDLGEFYMVLGAQREDLTGDAILYKSSDLQNWQLLGSLLEEREELGYMWECPDLVRLGNRDVFLFSPQGLQEDGYRFRNIFQTGYYTGRFEAERFQKDKNSFDELDRGFEFYAPQTFDMPDGRVLLLGWMGTMEKEKEEALPTMREGWVHHLTIPRELRVNAEGKVLQTPALELMRFFREENVVSGKDLTIGRKESFLLEVLNEHEAQRIRIRVSSDVELKLEDRWFTVERISWLDGKKEIRQVPLPLGLKDLKIIGDHTSLEIFINGGEEVFSLRCFDDDSDRMISLVSSETVTLKISGFQKD